MSHERPACNVCLDVGCLHCNYGRMPRGVTDDTPEERRIAELEEQNRALREVVEKYGTHRAPFGKTKACPAYYGIGFCDCGLDAALLGAA